MKFSFPKEFSFGSAFSGPQTEGMKNKKEKNIFDADYDKNKKIYFEQRYVANDFYDNFREDIKLAKELGLDELRTSIQWSRLVPDGKNVDADAVRFYNEVIDAMEEEGITPTFALHHFDMPVWAQKKGGWLSRDVVDKFVFYASEAFRLFGDRVKAWFTFNEPSVPVQAGYLYAFHPPYIKDAKKSIQVQWNSLIAHHKCVAVHKQMGLDSKYGAILDFCAAMPASDSPKDKKAAEMFDMWKWRCYSDPMFKGEFPKEYEDKLEELGLKFTEEPGDRELIKNNTIDYFGINYYSPAWAKAPKDVVEKDAIFTEHFFSDYKPPFLLMNASRGWAVYPYGIYHSIKKINELYGDKVTIYISENGMGVENEYAFKDKDGIVQDDYRIQFFQMHLAYVVKAMSEGIPVRGYHSWAYLDNWSWSNAYKNRYGSVSLDVETGKRSMKKSAGWWKNVTSTREIIIEDHILDSPFLQPKK